MATQTVTPEGGRSASWRTSILDTPHIVPRLQPELLHRVIQHDGLEDCGELVALATAEQLSRINQVRMHVELNAKITAAWRILPSLA